MSHGVLSPDGSVSFIVYVDAETTAEPSHIIRAELLDPEGALIESWSGKKLSVLPQTAIENVYAYHRFVTGFYGLDGPVSAKAKIRLSSTLAHLNIMPGRYRLQLYSIDGNRWDLMLQMLHP